MSHRTSGNGHPQLDLLGDSGRQTNEVHRLFLALLPDEATRDVLSRTADALKAGQPQWRARWVNPARYHATLHFLGDHPGLRPEVVDAVTEAAKNVQAAGFTWVLQYASCFHGRQPPCVLRSTDVCEPLQALWLQWQRALILAGQGAHLGRSQTPHLTLAYGQNASMQSTSINPVSWKVDEVALIHSVIGYPDYETLARWPLISDRASAQG